VLNDIGRGRPPTNQLVGTNLARAAGKQLGHYRLVQARKDRDGAQWWRIEYTAPASPAFRTWPAVTGRTEIQVPALIWLANAGNVPCESTDLFPHREDTW
jgi:hypothetical protein